MIAVPAGFPGFLHPDVDLGGDVYAQFIRRRPGSADPSGAWLAHRRASSPTGWCVSTVEWWRATEGDWPIWSLGSLDPLALHPQVRCHCGLAGWVRGGRWVPA